MQLLYNRRDGGQGSVGAGVVCLLLGVGAIVQVAAGWVACGQGRGGCGGVKVELAGLVVALVG